MAPPPDFDTLTIADIARLADGDRLPPVDRWHPTHCGDSDMRIARDGTWYHQGSPIGRQAMVRAFSRILRREPDGGYVLVTPGEKLDIAVEDAPFVAVELKAEGEGREAILAFRLNTGEMVTASAAHPIRFVDRDDGPHPYVRVRGGLDALVARSVYYELAERALADDAEPAGGLERGRVLPDRAMTLAERLAARLVRDSATAFLPGDSGDLPPHDQLTAAAVLIAITDRAEPGVILTQRTETLRKHPGQVAFPGGRVDPGETAVEAALREAQEEVAMPPHVVEVIGTTDLYRTGTGFSITPVVGVIPPDLSLVPAEAEVASVFEVPLAFLLDTANHHPQRTMWDGRERQYFEMPWQDRRIWGATAGMIVNLARRLQ